MGGKVFTLFLAALSGAAMAVQGTVNSTLGKVTGLWEATFIVHLTGLLLVAFLLFVFRTGQGGLAAALQAPWYAYFGGVLGVIIVYLVIRSIPKVGVAPATTAIILGQVFTAGLIDHLGLLGANKIPFTVFSAVGALLMAGGAFLLLRQ